MDPIKKMKLWQKILLIVGVLIFLAGIGVYIGARSIGDSLEKSISEAEQKATQQSQVKEKAIVYNNDLTNKRKKLFEELNTMVYAIDHATTIKEVEEDIESFEAVVEDIEKYLQEKEAPEEAQKIKEGHELFVKISEEISKNAKEYLKVAQESSDFTKQIDDLNQEIDMLNEQNQKLNDLAEELNQS